jgi:hypothetical protein
MKTRTEVIGPELAAFYLTFNTANRPLKQAHVNFLASQMSENTWKQDGSPIRFSSNPITLLDGQHRLQAIVISGKSYPFLVVEDLPHDTFKTIDTGKTRSLADAFAISGINGSALAASVTGFLYRYGQMSLITAINPGRNHRQNSETLLRFYNELPRIETFLFDGRAFYSRFKVLTPTIFVSLLYIFAKIDFSQAYDFFEKFSSGQDLKSDDSIYVLRKRLIDDSTSHTRLSEAHKVVFVIMAWNYYRKNKKVSVIRWDGKLETIPTPI